MFTLIVAQLCLFDIDLKKSACANLNCSSRAHSDRCWSHPASWIRFGRNVPIGFCSHGFLLGAHHHPRHSQTLRYATMKRLMNQHRDQSIPKAQDRLSLRCQASGTTKQMTMRQQMTITTAQVITMMNLTSKLIAGQSIFHSLSLH